MKKIFILLVVVLFIGNVAISQPTLNFKILNPRIEQISLGGIKSFLCFDVQVSASAGGTYFDGIQTVLTFNTTGLNATGVLNRQVLKGPLASGDLGGTLFYNVTTNWQSGTNRLFIGVISDPAWAGAPGDPLYMNEVTTTYQTLVTVKIQIEDITQVANLVLVPGSMDGVSTYRDINGVSQYYNSPYNYDPHDLYDTYCGRIYSSYNGGQWSQAGNTVAGTGWTDWTTSVNTSVWDGNGHISNTDALVTGLYVETGGVLTIDPNKSLTASGNSHFEDSQSLVIASDISGVGSFIDNGTITYGASGSASVQTFLANSGGVGSYYMHQVGPTVNDPSFETDNGYFGVYLNSFDVSANDSYAYFYDEATNSWQNVYMNTTQVPTAQGLILSTTDNSNHTLTMTGELVNGTGTTHTSLGHSGNNIDLISNPYPSSLDFNAFYTANNTIIGSTYYVWDPTIGNYSTYTSGVGGDLTSYVLPGQGFFVTTLQSAVVTYNSDQRVHGTGPLVKDMTPYLLSLEVQGNTYKNYSFIHFSQDATYGYDELYDAHKWPSIFEDATEISTMSSDMQELCMNSVPMLGSEIVTIPLTFKCGAEGNYTITASGIGSFDAGTEIWLEDLATGAEWWDLVANPVYEFTGQPDGDHNRFLVHFFGPTGIDEPVAQNAIRIYGYGQDAYIVNQGKETIQEYIAYDMMGRELHRGTLPNNTVNKVQIGDVSAYYIVKVITKEGKTYSGKVFITK